MIYPLNTVVVDTFGDAYPELVKNQADIIEIITEEEEAFSTMLDRGIKYFDEEINPSTRFVVPTNTAQCCIVTKQIA